MCELSRWLQECRWNRRKSQLAPTSFVDKLACHVVDGGALMVGTGSDFSVRHYAGTVTYHSAAFVTRNKDKLYPG